MFRILLELLGAFALPFLAYGLILQGRRLFSMSEKEWTRDVAITLSLIGLVLCAALMMALWLFAERGHGAYTPAHIENGRVIPGHLD